MTTHTQGPMDCSELMFSDDGSSVIARCIRPFGEEHSHHDMQPCWYINNELAVEYDGPAFGVPYPRRLIAAAPRMLGFVEWVAEGSHEPDCLGRVTPGECDCNVSSAQALLREIEGE